MLDNEDNINNDLIEIKEQRDSSFYESELKTYISENEGEKIKEDIKLLQEMGYDRKMINKVYILLQPANIERAVDYMSEIDGIYQHDFFENHNVGKDKNLCFICQKPKKFHLDYIPDEYLVENNNNNINANNDEQNDYRSDNNKDSFSYDNISEENYEFLPQLKKKSNNNNNDKKQNYNNKNKCKICFDEIEENEIESNALECGHACCTQCWKNYLKTLITDAKVEEIKCIEHKCKEILPEEFLFKFIHDDKKLLDKYNKFKARAIIIKDPNKKQCPKADCESYLEKSSKTQYVKCKNGHQFCFECLRPPHGSSSCDQLLEKDFLKWKKNRVVKKCPRCHIFTEKNEGCNHMTCTSCKYQWCWLCLGAYSYGHYTSGACSGHQFTRANNLQEAKKGIRSVYYARHKQKQHLCCFTLYTIFPDFFHGFDEPFQFYELWERYLAIFVMWIFGFFLFAGVTMVNSTLDRIDFTRCEAPYFIIGFLIAICLFVCFQILFTCLITPFILISLVYPKFIDHILMFLDINFN